MRRRFHAVLAATMVLRDAGAAAQTTAIDFDRDVKPLLRDKGVGVTLAVP
jgi:hypothetical protein